MKHILFIALAGLILILAVLLLRTESNILNIHRVSNFAECVAAGNPVMESFPERCRDAKTGTVFVNDEQTLENEFVASIRTISVGPEMRECVGVAPRMCLVVDGELFYDRIEAFEYEPGFSYELRIREIPIQNPPADASSIRYELIEEISKTATVRTSLETPQIEPIATLPTKQDPTISNESSQALTCVRAGCSRQLCVDAKNSDVISTCEFLPEYACYTDQSCEVQADGTCGFSVDTVMQQCIAAARISL